MDVPIPSQPFRRFLRYALEYRALLVLAMVAGVAKFSLNYTFPWLIGSAVDTIAQRSAASRVMSFAQREHWIWVLVQLGIVFSVLHGAASFCRGYFTAKLGNRIIADLRQDQFDHLHRLSLHFYSREKTGSIVSRLISDIQTAGQLINGGVISVVMDCTSMIIGLVLLFHISWRLALACMTIMPLYAITFKFINPRIKLASLRVQNQLSKISGSAQERLSGIALVKAYATERRERERFNADTEEHYDRTILQSTLAQTVQGLSELIVHLGQVIVIGFGGWLALRHSITPGQIVTFIGTLAVMYLPVRRLAEINVIYQQAMAAIERVFQVFDVAPAMVQKPDAIRQPPQRGQVIFERVGFHYGASRSEALYDPERPDDSAPLDRPILGDLNFRVEPGERIALVGPSGSGKTTLVSLLPRLYDVTGGRILIDGIDVRDYRMRPLRRSIGIVQQDSFLLSGNIRDNIAYGKPDATDEQVAAAAYAANAHEFITALPDGYQAVIGERGVNLSGGQRQRISIARAILKDPRILILDEATSALDSESEAIVQQALEHLMHGRTCFIIAHRLSTVRNVDRIFVMQNGRIIETGAHDALLRNRGLYARLIDQQFGAYLEESRRMLAEQSAI